MSTKPSSEETYGKNTSNEVSSARSQSSNEANFSMLMGNQPTDIVVVTADGRRFPVHKLVLFAQSKFFSESPELAKKGAVTEEIHLDFITSDVFSVVQEFMYSGTVSIKKTQEEEMKKLFSKLGIKIKPPNSI
ncbi:unnamed protein product [Allacma fusca]|uniref:BTB domain-containing protein n=1 Tax=Allacma fusca TaxID=39272 RepID=A0A8J2L611_9HEXA|nr:unnamed protein product [Allacma fusca]